VPPSASTLPKCHLYPVCFPPFEHDELIQEVESNIVYSSILVQQCSTIQYEPLYHTIQFLREYTMMQPM